MLRKKHKYTLYFDNDHFIRIIDVKILNDFSMNTTRVSSKFTKKTVFIIKLAKILFICSTNILLFEPSYFLQLKKNKEKE